MVDVVKDPFETLNALMGSFRTQLPWIRGWFLGCGLFVVAVSSVGLATFPFPAGLAILLRRSDH